MGNTCSPDKKEGDSAPVTDMDKQAAVEEAQEGGAQPGEKLTQVINAYQAENERLKKEVEEYKTQETVRQESNQADSANSDELMRELETMRALVKQKDQAVVKSKVQAALFQHVSTMKDAANAAEVLKKGTLEKFRKGGKAALGKAAHEKFVEVSLHKGSRVASGFEPGVIRLSYAETEGAGQVSTGRVVKVNSDVNMAQKYKGRCFAIEFLVDGINKDLVFACPDTDTRDSWVNTFQKGFDRVRNEAESMNENFNLTLTFSKEKLGIRVEEKVIEDEPLCLDAEQEKKEDEEDIPAPAEEDTAEKAEDKAENAEDAAPAAEEAADAEKAEEEVANEPAAAEEEGEGAAEPAAAEEEPAQAAAAAEEKVEDEEEPPCTLTVTAISDEDLMKKGLHESMTLVKLNDTDIKGLPYSKQLGMLTQTEKPFTITFSGPNYLKLGQETVTVFPAILKQLTAEQENDAQVAFKAIIKGSQFEEELAASNDKNALIAELMSNQHKLQNLLQSVSTHSADL